MLLPKLGVRQLVLGGIASDSCILFTAADAHMRDYDLWVPRDAVSSVDPGRRLGALAIMAERLGAEIAPCSQLMPGDWLGRRHDRSRAA